MGLFRKKETYNEQMLREAGLDRVVMNTPTPAAPPALEAAPAPRTVANASFVAGHVTAVPRDWDATTATTAPGITGDRAASRSCPTAT